MFEFILFKFFEKLKFLEFLKISVDTMVKTTYPVVLQFPNILILFALNGNYIITTEAT